jgi:DNA-binding MarR family transcriptional regulator
MRLTSPGGELTPTELVVLTAVVRHGRIGLAHLAAEEGVNPTMLSRVVGRLELAGIVERTEDAADRRAVTISVTPKGADLYNETRLHRADTIERALDALGSDAWAQLTTALPHLEALAEQLKADPS